MAMLTPAYRVRPLDVGEILDESFRIYRSHFALMFGVAVVATLPALIVAIGSGSAFNAFQQSFTAAQDGTSALPAQDAALGVLTLVGFVVGFIMFPITTGAPIYAACSVVLGLPATVGSILRDSLRNYWRVWGLGIIYGALLLSSLVIISIPFVILVAVRWAFRYQVLYLEHAGVGGSLSRSSALVRDYWWRIFLIMLLVLIVIPFVLGIVVNLMATILSFAAPAGIARVAISGLLSALVQSLVLPFKAIASTLLYLDLRVRKESLDLQLMAGQAGQSVEYAQPPAELPPSWSDFPPPSAG
ncbi:MAG: hypothetical protein QOK05_2615 [Chloroflexota bacterium]|jgi:hypothetical protein|nr:hypothetical protein [Chloroflexota bacterium]